MKIFTLLAFVFVVFSGGLSTQITKTEISFDSKEVSTIRIKNIAEVILLNAEKDGITIVKKEKSLPDAMVVTEGNVVYIQSPEKVKAENNNYKVCVYMKKNIHTLDLKNVGKVKNKDVLKVNVLNVDLESIGSVNLKIDTENFGVIANRIVFFRLTGKTRKIDLKKQAIGVSDTSGLKILEK